MKRSWPNFRRMQATGLAAAVLIYAGAALHGWQVLSPADGLRAQTMLLFPAMFLLLTVGVIRWLPAAQRWVRDYVWRSYRAGFGQSAVSVMIGIGLLAGAGLVIYWQVAEAARGGESPAGAFSAYGAGIGILIAQHQAARALERDPEVRRFIDGD